MIGFIAKNVASYGITKGLDALLKQNKETFINQLQKAIDDTIDEYNERFPQKDIGKNFSFYKSQIIIEEFLKFRLFETNGYALNEDNIRRALEKNPNIIKPTSEQLKSFFDIFDKHVNSDPLLKKLEINEFHEEKIFVIYEKVEKILSYLDTHLVEVIGLLQEEYQQEITECYNDLKDLKPATALRRLENIEKRVNENAKHVSKKLKANLEYVKGRCYEGLSIRDKSYECFVKVYLSNPENPEYYGRACMSYYLLKDNSYIELLNKIRETDPYDSTLWALKAILSDNIVDFINKKVPENVKKKNRFLRLIFYHSAKNREKLNKTLSQYALEADLPEIINYDNIHYWIFVFNIAAHDYFYELNIPFKGHIDENKDSLYLLQLGKKLTKSIEHSELHNEYFRIVFFTYWLECEIEKQPHSFKRLEETYNRLNEKDSFLTLLLANTIQKNGNKEKAIKIIDSYDGLHDELLIALKIFCFLDTTPNLITFELIREYFQALKTINSLNIINLSNFILPILIYNLIDSADLSALIEEATYSKTSYKKLLLLLIASYNSKSNEVTIEKISELKKELQDDNTLNLFIALILFNTMHYKECAGFIKTYLDETKESRDLALLIEALFADEKSDQMELLRLLKLWRERYSFNEKFIRYEIELRQIIQEWNEVLAISKYGLSKQPQDEGFYSTFILSLFQLNKNELIEKELPNLLGFFFSSTQNTLLISRLLINNNYKKEGLELAYKRAVNKNDIDARMYYLYLSSKPEFESLFQELDVVSANTFVKLEIDGEQKVFHIDSDSISQPILSKSIEKHKGETFFIEEKVGNGHKQVRVLKVMNKYLALVTEIIDEANSPFTNLNLRSIKFESDDLESLNKTLIKNFGIEQAQITKQRKELFNDYYIYKIFFTQLVISIFDNNYIEAYNYLTSKESNGFYILPLKYLEKGIKIISQKIVVDFTSGILFYELSKKFSISFTNLFVPDSFYYALDMAILKAEEEKRSHFKLIINEKDVIPIHYPEGYHTNRISYLKDLKAWFLQNTTQELPKERIGLIRGLKKHENIPQLFEYFIDTILLAQRKGYVLVSDDLFYRAKNRFNNVISTEKYLATCFNEFKNVFYEYLLSKKYIGLTIDEEVLYSAYINRTTPEKELNYNYALRNIGLKENFNTSNIETVVGFLKKAALNPVISVEQYRRDATVILAVLLPNIMIDIGMINMLKKSIMNSFHLMGDYLEVTLQALLDATKIIKKN